MSISDQGNTFAENTDAVKEYIASLREATLIELEGQRTANLENEVKLKEKLKDSKNEVNSLLDEMNMYTKLIKMDEDEIADRISEIDGLYRKIGTSQKEKKELQEEQIALINIQSGKYTSQIGILQDKIDAERQSQENTEKQLEKVDALNNEMGNLILKQAGINEEGEKGLEHLDKLISKNSEELKILDDKLKITGNLTDEESARYNALTETTDKQKEAKNYLFDELGLYKDINSVAEFKLSQLDKESPKKVNNLAKTAEIKVEEGNILKQLEDKNSEYDRGIDKLEKQREKEGANKKEIDKQISALMDKKVKNEEVIQKVLKELGIWGQVKDSINLGAEAEKRKRDAANKNINSYRSQGSLINENNEKTRIGILREQDRTKKAERHVGKEITVTDKGTIAQLNKKATEGKTKPVNLVAKGLADLNRLAGASITKRVNLFSSGTGMLKYAKGTPPSGHPGGPAVIGEKGSELVTLPSGSSFVSPSTDTLLDFPKGSHVVPHQQTKRIIKKVPRYATGTEGWTNALGNSEFARLLALNNKNSNSEVVFAGRNSGTREDKTLRELLNATLKQNNILTQLLEKNTGIYIDGKEMAEKTAPHMSKELNNLNKSGARKNGVVII